MAWAWTQLATGLSVPDLIGKLNERMKRLEQEYARHDRYLVSVVTFTASDATPSVQNGGYFETANAGATSITNFDDGLKGQLITVKVDANTTVKNNATIKLAGAVDFVGTSNDMISLRLGADSIWREVARSVN